MIRRQFLRTTSALPLAVAALAAAAIPAMTWDAPTGGYSTMSPIEGAVYATTTAAKPKNVPTWESHGGAASCHRLREGEVADVVLVVTQRGVTERVTFDEAWERSHDGESANDVWTIGACS